MNMTHILEIFRKNNALPSKKKEISGIGWNGSHDGRAFDGKRLLGKAGNLQFQK